MKGKLQSTLKCSSTICLIMMQHQGRWPWPQSYLIEVDCKDWQVKSRRELKVKSTQENLKSQFHIVRKVAVSKSLYCHKWCWETIQEKKHPFLWTLSIPVSEWVTWCSPPTISRNWRWHHHQANFRVSKYNHYWS